jgi:hypothetical protein
MTGSATSSEPVNSPHDPVFVAGASAPCPAPRACTHTQHPTVCVLCALQGACQGLAKGVPAGVPAAVSLMHRRPHLTLCPRQLSAPASAAPPPCTAPRACQHTQQPAVCVLCALQGRVQGLAKGVPAAVPAAVSLMHRRPHLTLCPCQLSAPAVVAPPPLPRPACLHAHPITHRLCVVRPAGSMSRPSTGSASGDGSGEPAPPHLTLCPPHMSLLVLSCSCKYLVNNCGVIETM